MSREWKECTLGDVVNFRRGHDLPKSKMKSGRYPVMGSNGVIGFHNEYTTKSPCVSIGRSGNVGNPKILKQDCWAHNTTLYIDDFKGNDPLYVYYLLHRLNLANYKGGSAVPTLNRNHIHPIELSIPPLPEQKAIAHIIGTLDDKIELNRKMNETLEQMAQALFKSWFVDFDPVFDNAIAKGNKIPDALLHKAGKRKKVLSSGQYKTLPKELMELFPSSFVFNEELEQWIPEGWATTNMFQELESISKTYPLKEVDKVVFLNTGDIQEGSFLHQDYSDPKGLPGQAKKSIQKSDILYSEIRPKNKRFAYVYFEPEDYVVSTKLMVLRPKSNIDSLFYYQILKSQNVIDELQFLAESRSGTFPQITFDTLKYIDFVLPNESRVLENYIRSIRMYFERTIVNSKQIESLTKQRDALLPQLISGKLRVCEEMIERF
ncbi:restriction endonuclease subunit S [Thermophagus sp. OGC60D27]|uniref:restriction endonuclease subunit S n=1 Tax=Thermophagus sp. OGC60D27 TaxID=3458415 RepID=UPI004038366E